MAGKGRPRQYDNDNEGARTRMARLRAQRKNQAPEDIFENTFLTSDCRLIQAPVNSGGGALDNLQDALDAVPLERVDGLAHDSGDGLFQEEIPVPLTEPGIVSHFVGNP